MPSELPSAGAPPAKTKIAVLGAGMGSIAAMYELTQLPENRAKYDITVYTLGWRVGGKGASARNQQMGGRIEEHGLHIWFGFYDNAFKVMRDAYREMQRSPELPLSSFEKAFTPQDFIVLMDEYKGEWRTPWQYTFPATGGTPGDGGDLPSFWEMAWFALKWLMTDIHTFLLNLHHPCGTDVDSKHDHAKEGWWPAIQHVVGDIDRRVHELETVPAGDMLALALSAISSVDKKIESLDRSAVADIEASVCTLLEKYRAWLWDKYGCHVDDDVARRCLVMADIGTTCIIGVLRDQVRTKGIFSIDVYELSDWLTRHGANPVTLGCPLIRSLYDNIFAFENGDVSKPNAGAGTSLLWLARMVFTYKGHLMYKMNAGMGDTIFTPFYQVLKARGVTFKFFHCVQNLGLDAGKNRIETIQVMPQVDLTVEDYDPLVVVKDLPCWPSQPNWEQIKDGEALRERGVNLEAVCTPYDGRTPTILERGRDFDLVILGIPIAAVAPITRELSDNSAKPAWKTMIDRVKTVQTQAYQLWFNRTLDDLGWISGSDSPVLGTYVELIDTYADMSHLIPVENQPAGQQVRSIAYFCGAMPDTKTQADADVLAFKNASDNTVNNMPRLWRRFQEPDGAIHWDWLVDPQNREGQARFDAQFVRANWTGTERYTLSVAGSTQYRLRTDQTGYDNLYIVGDWIENGFNSGCIEASTMSGMQASRAICGYPAKIVGENSVEWLGD
jgi:uncharacterized protein with NAD-binding domain and iron-sulfur cluster